MLAVALATGCVVPEFERDKYVCDDEHLCEAGLTCVQGACVSGPGGGEGEGEGEAGASGGGDEDVPSDGDGEGEGEGEGGSAGADGEGEGEGEDGGKDGGEGEGEEELPPPLTVRVTATLPDGYPRPASLGVGLVPATAFDAGVPVDRWEGAVLGVSVGEAAPLQPIDVQVDAPAPPRGDDAAYVPLLYQDLDGVDGFTRLDAVIGQAAGVLMQADGARGWLPVGDDNLLPFDVTAVPRPEVLVRGRAEQARGSAWPHDLTFTKVGLLTPPPSPTVLASVYVNLRGDGSESYQLTTPHITDPAVLAVIGDEVSDATRVGLLALWDDVNNNDRFDEGSDRCIAANFARYDQMIGRMLPSHLELGVTQGHWISDVTDSAPFFEPVAPEDDRVIVTYEGMPGCAPPDSCAHAGDFTACDKGGDEPSFDRCVAHACSTAGCGEAHCNSPGGWFRPPDPDRALTVTGGEQPVIRDDALGLRWASNTPEHTWSDAVGYCAGLNYGGFLNWRLPDMHELGSLVDFSASPASVNPAAVPAPGGDPGGIMWTSTTHPADAGLAMAFNYGVGELVARAKNQAAYVRCVRGSPRPRADEPRYSFQDFDERSWAVDSVGGLRWRAPDAEVYAFADVDPACRLPTVHQWLTIMTARHSRYGLDSAVFGGVFGAEYWAADPVPTGPASSWVVRLVPDDRRLTIGHAPRAEQKSVMCVVPL